jgi:hypothetical protein
MLGLMVKIEQMGQLKLKVLVEIDELFFLDEL